MKREWGTTHNENRRDNMILINWQYGIEMLNLNREPLEIVSLLILAGQQN